MNKNLKIIFSIITCKRIAALSKPQYASIPTALAVCTLRNSSIFVYNASEIIPFAFAGKKPWRVINSLLTVLLVFSVSIVSAQDMLVGLTSNGGPEGKGTAYSIKTDTKAFNVIKGFADWGATPAGALIRGADGNLYGVAQEGGTYGHGTIFRITPAGDILILKNLNLTIDGGYPKGSLIQAKDGNFYGTASGGSINNGGCIFKITPAGQYSIIRSLSINTDGGRPQGHLLQATDGNFYGINNAGGAFGYGTIFKLTPGGQYTVIKSFNGTSEGGQSYGSLVQASDGALYGMANSGGTYRYGVIFRITLSSSYSVLRHLNGATDGGYPTGDLIQGKDGLLYGMTPSGGGNYNGTAFKINVSGTSFTLLKAMSAGVQGGNVKGSLIQASDGNFYGMAYSLSGGYAGSIFKMTGGGSFTVIKKFSAANDGGYPLGSLIQTPDGLLFGMTSFGGKNQNGTIFKIATSGSNYTVLSHLNGASQGNVPQGNLTLGKDSAYYGVTQYGGVNNHGTIFKICGGVTTTLRSLSRNSDGGNPVAGLVRGKDGNLYGMTETGGGYSGGTVFKISPAGVFAVLRHLKGATDGQNPKGALALNAGTDSALYGITYSGGSSAGGTIFKITMKGAFAVLRNLVPATDGNGAQGGLVLGKDGAFYGMTSSSFFKIKPDGSAFTVLHTFSYNTEGSSPASSLIIGADDAFYGTLTFGGSYSKGTLFRITNTGTVTVLRHLNAATDGSFPKGSLVRGSDGAFYGTTTIGGGNNAGTIFRITPAKAFTVLRHLTIAKDGGMPMGGLIIAPKTALTANGQSGVTTAEDMPKAITLSGSGAANLTFTIVAKPRYGAVTGGTAAARIYTPANNFSGVDSFAFTANVGCLASAPAWVKISVSPANDAPVLSPIGNKTVVKGAQLKFTATATDVDPGQTKTFSLIAPPSGASINATSGAFSWTPNATGTYTFKVRVTDNGSPVLYDEEQITVTVTTSFAAKANSMETSVRTEDISSVKPSIFPNPVINNFNVKCDGLNDQVTIRIIDSKGSVLFNKNYQAMGKQHLQVEATQLRPGQYFLQLQSGQKFEILKFIKM